MRRNLNKKFLIFKSAATNNKVLHEIAITKGTPGGIR